MLLSYSYWAREFKKLVKLKLYKLSQTTNIQWSVYDSCVVVASSLEEARRVNPSQFTPATRPCDYPGMPDEAFISDETIESVKREALIDPDVPLWVGDLHFWTYPENVNVQYLADLPPDTPFKAGDVIVASFNAG